MWPPPLDSAKSMEKRKSNVFEASVMKWLRKVSLNLNDKFYCGSLYVHKSRMNSWFCIFMSSYYLFSFFGCNIVFSWSVVWCLWSKGAERRFRMERRGPQSNNNQSINQSKKGLTVCGRGRGGLFSETLPKK